MMYEIIEEMLASPAATGVFCLIIAYSVAAFFEPRITNHSFLHPASITEGKRLHTMLTAGFIHSNWKHLVINLFLFYAFAFDLEKLSGSYAFVLVFTGGLLFGNIGTVWHNRNDQLFFTMGSSGGTLAVLIALAILSPATRLLPLPILGNVSNLYIVAIFITGLFVLTKIKRFPFVDHHSHFYGGVAGAILALISSYVS